MSGSKEVANSLFPVDDTKHCPRFRRPNNGIIRRKRWPQIKQSNCQSSNVVRKCGRDCQGMVIADEEIITRATSQWTSLECSCSILDDIYTQIVRPVSLMLRPETPQMCNLVPGRQPIPRSSLTGWIVDNFPCFDRSPFVSRDSTVSNHTSLRANAYYEPLHPYAQS